MVELRDFTEIWVTDAEYQHLLGEHVNVHCLCAREVRSGRRLRLWRDQLQSPPYRMDPDCLFVFFNATAELSVHLSLDWPLPFKILDLSPEFRCLTNGLVLPDGRGLLGAMSYFRLDAISVAEKDLWRDLAIQLTPEQFTLQQRKGLMDYCEQDVIATVKLLGRMWDKIHLPQALHRGRFMRALAMAEWNGIPIDTATLAQLRRHWQEIKLDLIAAVDKDYRCYTGTSFKLDQFAKYLRGEGILRNWPVTDVGRLSKSDETFREMARAYPKLRPLRELNYTISKMRLEKLAVGHDRRNHVQYWAFSTKTSRNAPKASEFIFSPSAWLRSLIKPEPGTAVAYVDFSAQELGTSAILSGDCEMIKSYDSGDPYLSFGKTIGEIPLTATKESHGKERDKFKLCLLGILYGMTAKGLAVYSGLTETAAEKVLASHKRLHKPFWTWSDAVEEQARLKGKIHTCYGWRFSAPWKPAKPDSKKREGVPARTIRNFPVQATAAEMFRLAVCLMTERGVTVCALVHDAVLIETPIDEIDHAVDVTRAAMAEASRIIFKGRLELRTDAKVIKYPDRFFDGRGKEMWHTVMTALAKAQQRQQSVPESEQLGLSLWA